MPKVDIRTGLFEKQDFLRLLTAEVDDALREGRPYAVLAVVPQHFPNEDMTDVVRIAASCVRDLVRDGDLAGHVDDEIMAIGLFNGDRTAAAILSQRLQSDLRLRSFHLRSTNWETGVACIVDDGKNANDLLDAAISAARNRRRRLAGLV
jgi:GGDEF domain-containing protein